MYIEIEEGVWGLSATPDPTRTFNLEELQQELERKQQEVTMYENEIVNLAEKKTALEAEVAEIEALIS